jgi:hypothetical protein
MYCQSLAQNRGFSEGDVFKEKDALKLYFEEKKYEMSYSFTYFLCRNSSCKLFVCYMVVLLLSQVFWLVCFLFSLEICSFLSFFPCFIQTCNKFTHLYAFVHNDIYHLLHTISIRQISERTGKINQWIWTENLQTLSQRWAGGIGNDFSYWTQMIAEQYLQSEWKNFAFNSEN